MRYRLSPMQWDDMLPEILVENAAKIQYEQLGSKPKFWVRDSTNDRRGIMKLSRPGVGEDWAECVVARIAHLLGIPHAEYELARTDDGRLGVLTWTFLESRADGLEIGNWILAGSDSTYPRVEEPGKHRMSPGHTVEAVLQHCSLARPPVGFEAPAVIANGADVMVGYLMLDALVGNTDRHDENWGWIKPAGGGPVHLTPTYDHASSLGRELTDEKRAMRLATRDPNASVSSYAARARSAFHRPGDPKPMLTQEAFARARELRPEAALYWMNRLAGLRREHWENILGRVPDHRISAVARAFASGILGHNLTVLSRR